MAASGGVKAWNVMLQKNNFVPVAWDRQQEASDFTQPFCLTFSIVEGLVSKVDQVLGYQLRVSLYDATYKHFFGRTWIGPIIQAKTVGQKICLNYNQPVYFHTSFTDEALVVVVEVVAVIPTDSVGGEAQISCGWGLFHPFNPDLELHDVASGKPPHALRLDMYYGSPRALVFLDEPLEGNSSVSLIHGCQVMYSIQTHRHLRRAIHLLPENTLVGTNDIIPGLVEAPRDPRHPGAPPDNLRKPRILKRSQCHLEGISVTLAPSLEKLEEDLCRQLNEDRIARQNTGADGNTVIVMERKLTVGIHNGWTYVQEPVTVFLNAEAEGGNTSIMKRSASLRRGSTFTGHRRTPSASSLPGAGANVLTCKSRITLEGLAEDPLFTLVFLLEYMLGQPVSKEDKQASMATSATFPVAVRWAAWSPFAAHSSHHSVPLVGGPSTNPDLIMLFRSPLADILASDENLKQPMVGSIGFSFSGIVKGKENQGLMPEMTSSFTVPSPRPRSPSHDSIGTEESHGVLHAVQLQGKPPIPGGRHVTHGVDGSPTTPRIMGSSYPVPGGYAMSPGYPVSPGYPMGQAYPAYPAFSPFPMGPAPSTGTPTPRGVIPVEIQHVRDPMALSGSVNPDLQELPFTPVHAPVLAVAPGMTAGQGLSRAAYAQLYSVGFPQIVDRNGEAPDVVDPGDPFNFILAKEEADKLQANEVILQFLAYSRFATFHDENTASKPATIFLTFQFYRFPQVTTERLLLGAVKGGLSVDPQSLPCVLHRLNRDGSVVKEPPGFQVKYHLDPSYLKPGEGRLFVQHLSQQTLHIDVWDGDSLLLIGSSAVDLKYLCRQGREGVQVTFELDVVATEYVETEVPPSELSRGDVVRPVDVHTVNKGRLHLRMANIGHQADPRLVKTDRLSMSTKPKVVIQGEINSNSQFLGGSLKALTSHYNALRNERKVAKAAHMAEASVELAAVLHSRHQVAKSDTNEKPTKQKSVTKQRKLARMQAVRQNENEEDPHIITSFRQEKDLRAKDLKTIELYRTQEKRDGILNMLSQAISTEHIIHPSFGTTEFFEFVLKNPYNVQHTIRIESDDPEVSVVTDPREWRFYKMASEIYTSVEEGMFHTETKSGCPEIFLRPKETVNVPFKFVTYRADHTVAPQGPSNPFTSKKKEEFDKKQQANDTRISKVYFRTEENKPVAILVLRIESQPHVIDQTFRFHHPEQSFLKKSIRLPPLHTLPGMPVGGTTPSQVFVKCSDPNIITESRIVQQGEPHDIFVKVACGASPQIKRFFIAIFADQFLWRPIQIWQFYVHALQRVDVSCQEGQTSRFTLVLRGTQASRLVQVFPSHATEMDVHPRDPFMLAAGTLTEVHVGVRPLSTGTRFMYVNVVDVEGHQLIRTWLVCVTCHAPVVSKAYELQVPSGGGRGCNKRIAYTNPYSRKKVFQLRCNRYDLLQFKDTRLEVAGGETVNIGLRFVPTNVTGNVEILVFINDEDDKNEETFCVRVTYM